MSQAIINFLQRGVGYNPTSEPTKVMTSSLYAKNLAHLKTFKDYCKAHAESEVINVSLVGDSIAEGGKASDYAAYGFATVVRDTLQSRWGNAGLGFISAWLRTNAEGTVRALAETFAWSDSGSACRKGNNLAYKTYTFTGDSVTVKYWKKPDAGEFTIAIDGGAPVTVDAEATEVSLGSHTITGLVNGSHTIVITMAEADRYLYLHGVVPYVSTAKGIRLNNHGNWGKSTDVLAESEYRIGALDPAPKLLMIALGANDFGTQHSLKEVKSNLNAIIDPALAAGSCVLIVARTMRGDTNLGLDHNMYNRMLYEVAVETGVALVDVDQMWGNVFSTADGKGYFDADDVHLTNMGHRQLAMDIMNVLI